MLSIFLILFASIFFPGIILRTRSLASGRKGPGILQPVKDVIRLFKKGSVYSETTTIIFRIAPVIYFSSVLMACMVVPFSSHSGIISFEGDFVFFAYILALGKFFSIIAAMDTGSSFEGMGASREALYSLLAEPAFFILIGSFALYTGHTSFYDIFSDLHLGTSITYLLGGLASVVLLMIVMIENSRMPVDDPKTHLELTMIHEVMILDNSGFDKALIHLGTYLKFAVYGSLMYNVIVPSEWNIYLQTALFFTVQVVFAIIIGFVESFRARNKMNKNPKFILSVSAIALIAFMIILVLTEKLNQ